MATVKEEIQKFFKGEVEHDDATLTKYSHDASLLEVRPALVLFPKDSEDVKNLVKWVALNKDNMPGGHAPLSITPRCAGTDMSGGAIGESLILDFTRHMNKLVGGPVPIDDAKFLDKKKTNKIKMTGAYPLVDSYITVQPGMFYRDFEKITLAKGLILPCYTASKSLNAMGGMYGNNSAGEKTLKYGQTQRFVLSAKVVFADGNEYVVRPLSQAELEKKITQNDFEGGVYKKIFNLINENKSEIEHAKPQVHKNSAGYYIWNVVTESSEILKNFSGLTLPGVPVGTHTVQNSSGFRFDMNQLLVGSQGTLGIVTEITFKIISAVKYSKLVTIFMNNLEPVGRLVGEILELKPETLETYDDKTMRLAVRFFPDFLRNKGLVKMMKFMWSFLPEFKMMLRGGFPKLILLVEFSGDNEEQVHADCERLVEKIKPFNLETRITLSTAEAEKYWDIRRESFALLRKHVKGKRTAPFIDDIIVRPEFMPKFLPELNRILDKYNLTYTIAGHAGDGNFHIIPLMDFSRSDVGRVVAELSEKVFDLVLKYHGSITAEHNDGIIRTPYLQKMYGEHVMKIFRDIKSTFDPKNIFNPGKKLASGNLGTKEYIASHIAKEHKADHRV